MTVHALKSLRDHSYQAGVLAVTLAQILSAPDWHRPAMERLARETLAEVETANAMNRADLDRIAAEARASVAEIIPALEGAA